MLLGVLALAAACLPERYSASALVLMPPGDFRFLAAGERVESRADSRVAEVRVTAAEPADALRGTRETLRQLAREGAVVIDEPRTLRRWPLLRPAALAGGALALVVAFILVRRKRTRRIPDRAAVREAVLLAQRGHQTLLVERGARFRAVIVDKRSDREGLQVLAKLSHGTLVYAEK